MTARLRRGCPLPRRTEGCARSAQRHRSDRSLHHEVNAIGDGCHRVSIPWKDHRAVRPRLLHSRSRSRLVRHGRQQRGLSGVRTNGAATTSDCAAFRGLRAGAFTWRYSRVERAPERERDSTAGERGRTGSETAARSRARVWPRLWCSRYPPGRSHDRRRHQARRDWSFVKREPTFLADRRWFPHKGQRD